MLTGNYHVELGRSLTLDQIVYERVARYTKKWAPLLLFSRSTLKVIEVNTVQLDTPVFQIKGECEIDSKAQFS